LDFVDIHSHILYGLDDGAKDAATSRAMLEMAAAAGTVDLVATPHANSKYRFDPELVEQRITELSADSPVRLHRGCDFRLQSDTIDDAIAHPRKYAINNRNYLLVEFPDFSIFASTDDVLMPLLDAGLIPIITHPERHGELRKRPDDLARWVEMGCYVQVTAGAATGRFGREAQAAAEEFVARGLVHFVASDAHDTRHRPPRLGSAYTKLADEWGEEAVRPMFVDNPRAVLIGDPIESDVRPVRRRKKSWYQFWG
jgi:protein-tyrosine phosphatase